jgi:hypothetical protein
MAAGNANVVWSADHGWHDGPRARVSMDAAGRLQTEILPEYVARVGFNGLNWSATLYNDVGQSVDFCYLPGERDRLVTAVVADVLHHWQHAYADVLITARRISRIMAADGDRVLWAD